MKALSLLIPIIALLACDLRAQSAPGIDTNSAAANALARRRQMLTNTFRRPALVTETNGPLAVAPSTNQVTFGVPPGVNAAPAQTATNVALPAATTSTATAVAAETAGPAAPGTVPAGQTAADGATPPTRTAAPPQFPQFPTLPSPNAAPATIPAPGAAATAVPGGVAAAGAPELEEGAIDFKGAPLDQVFEAYQDYSGRTILRPYQLPASAITIRSATPMSRKEAVQALDSVLSLNGIVMINLGDKFVKAVPAQQADKEGAEIDRTKTSELPDTEQFVTKVVILKTAKPSEVAQVLSAFSKSPSGVTAIDSNNSLVLRDYSSNIKRMMELIEKIDVAPQKDFTLAVIPIRYGKVGDIFATMSALISGGGGGGSGFAATGTGGRNQGGFGGFGSNANRSRVGGLGNSGYGGMGSSYNRLGGGYSGGYGGYGGSMYPQQVAQPSPAAGQNSFQQRLNSIVNKATKPEEQQVLENANIVPDERSNKLLIFANKRDMEMITNIVAKVDVLLAQVLIEAVILEVNLGDTLNYGVSAAQRGKQFTPNFFGAGANNNGQSFFSQLTNFPANSPSGFTYAGTFGNSFDVAIQAIATDRKASVISRPRIQTSHAIPGDIFVGETRPYVTGFSDYSFGTSLSTRSQVQEKVIGLTLSVTPFITPEGFVVMELQQQFDSFKGNLQVEGNPYPLVDSRMANSTLTVRDGDLIMLGGFITDSHTKSKSGVPLLKDIPGLGALFRSSNSEASRTELIILMKATVLESPEKAAVLANTERTTLPGVREAEMLQREDNDKRNKKVNKEIKAHSRDSGY